MKPEQSQYSDQELVRMASEGDQDAFGNLYERYLDPIFRYVYYRLSSTEEAEDIAEEIFLRAWEYLLQQGAKAEIQNVKAWIYRIAHNLVIDHHKKKKPVSMNMETQIEKLSTNHAGLEQEVQENLDAIQLRRHIQKLDETGREVILLRFINGLSHAETAEVLDLKEGHVRVLQYRALKALRKLLGESSHE